MAVSNVSWNTGLRAFFGIYWLWGLPRPQAIPAEMWGKINAVARTLHMLYPKSPEARWAVEILAWLDTVSVFGPGDANPYWSLVPKDIENKWRPR